jgi:guanylate kinase
VLINAHMDECLARVRAIIAAERSKRVRQTNLVPLVRGLIGPEH